jgi:hypothetical protein
MTFSSFWCLHDLVYGESDSPAGVRIATLPVLVCPMEEQPFISCRALSHLSVVFAHVSDWLFSQEPDKKGVKDGQNYLVLTKSYLLSKKS